MTKKSPIYLVYIAQKIHKCVKYSVRHKQDASNMVMPDKHPENVRIYAYEISVSSDYIPI